MRGIQKYTGGGQRSRCRNVVVRADSKLGELREGGEIDLGIFVYILYS